MKNESNNAGDAFIVGTQDNRVVKRDEDELFAVNSNKSNNPTSNILNQNNSLEDLEGSDFYKFLMNINKERAFITDNSLGQKSPKEAVESVLNIVKTGFIALEETKKSLDNFDKKTFSELLSKENAPVKFTGNNYKLNNGVKTSDINCDGEKVAELVKEPRKVNINGKEINLYHTKINIDSEKSKGLDIAAKVYLYDENGKQSDLSIVIGRDKNGISVISAQHDIERTENTKPEDLVQLKRDGKTYFMTITYDEYDKMHTAMLNRDKEMSKGIFQESSFERDKDLVFGKNSVNLDEIKNTIVNNSIENKTKGNSGAQNNGIENNQISLESSEKQIKYLIGTSNNPIIPSANSIKENLTFTSNAVKNNNNKITPPSTPNNTTKTNSIYKYP